MTKRIIAALLSLMIIFSVAMPLNVYGLNRDIEYQTEFMQKILKNIFGFSGSSYQTTVNEPEIETIKILAIGNSFSNDSVSWVYDIAKSAEIDVVVANLNFNGCSLETHWKNAISNNPYYSYQKWTSSGMTSESKKTMDSAILDEDWDYITLQQYSGYSGMYSTFQPYLNYLSSYIKKLVPDVRLALNMTWSYASDSTHADFAYYRSSQNIMYKAIVSAYRQAASDSGIDILIPCGTAIQNARANQSLNKIGDELTRDGFHLNEKTGRYVAGLTYFETLIVKEENIDKDIFEDVSFIPGKDSDKNIVSNAKNAAINAVENPFKITTETKKAYRD